MHSRSDGPYGFIIILVNFLSVLQNMIFLYYNTKHGNLMQHIDNLKICEIMTFSFKFKLTKRLKCAGVSAKEKISSNTDVGANIEKIP